MDSGLQQDTAFGHAREAQQPPDTSQIAILPQEFSSVAASSPSRIAVFVDYENVAKQDGHRLDAILAHVSSHGRPVMLRAYADWTRFAGHQKRLQTAGFELVEVPSNNGKNSADIKLTVDALETAFTKAFIETFVIVSCDSDFVPLVVKLNELNRRAWLYVPESKTAPLLEKFCYRLVLSHSLQSPAKKKCKSTGGATRQATVDSKSIQFSDATLLTMAWADRAWKALASDPCRLSCFFAAVRTLDPSFDMTNYFDSTKRCQVRLATFLQRQDFIEFNFDRAKNMHFVCGTERLRRLVADSPRPATWDAAVEELQCRYKRWRAIPAPTTVKRSPSMQRVG